MTLIWSNWFCNDANIAYSAPGGSPYGGYAAAATVSNLCWENPFSAERNPLTKFRSELVLQRREHRVFRTRRITIRRVRSRGDGEQFVLGKSVQRRAQPVDEIPI